MTSDFALELLHTMVNTPSYSGREHKLAAYLVEAMAKLGLQSTMDTVGNVIGETGKGGGPLILLLGHMDTVAGELPVYEENGILHGRGVVDAKGSLATLIMAAAALQKQSARIVVVGAVEEETPGSCGARALLDQYHPDAVIIGEPSGWSSVTIGYKGKLSFTLELNRPPSHSAGPGEKASDIIVKFWNQLLEHFETFEVKNSQFHRPTATISNIIGSGEYARLYVTCRIPPSFNMNSFVKFLNEISYDGSLWFEESTPAVVTERSTLPVQAMVSAIRLHDVRPKLKLKTGTSDMNIVAPVWMVPTIAYGPGDSSLSHTLDEYLVLEEYLRAISVLQEGITMLISKLRDKQQAQDNATYTPEEEEMLSKRLQSLGYL